MKQIELIVGDITKLEVDAIVNAANTSLLGGGGVDGAIHRAAGPKLHDECRQLKGCATGDAKITKAWMLPSKYVIHAVGPVWTDGLHDEAQLLMSCYKRSLEIAVKHSLKSIAFPCISTGVYRFPKEKAAIIALETIQDFLRNNKQIDKVILCTFDEENYQLYSRLLTH